MTCRHSIILASNFDYQDSEVRTSDIISLMKQKPHLTQNKYFDKVVALLNQAKPKLAMTHQLEFKKCFGAVTGYVDSKIFISCGKFGVALKLPKEILDELFEEKDVKHLQYFPKGHIKKDYAVLPKRVLDNARQSGKLVDASIKYLLSERK